MIYGHDSYACFAFYFLPPSFSCIITHIICWHKGSVENFKAAHRLHRSFITASHYSCVKKIGGKCRTCLFLWKEAELMSRYGTFTAVMRSGCRVHPGRWGESVVLFFSRILRGDDRCWHFTFSRWILKGAQRRSAPHISRHPPIHVPNRNKKKKKNKKGQNPKPRVWQLTCPEPLLELRCLWFLSSKNKAKKKKAAIKWSLTTSPSRRNQRRFRVLKGTTAYLFERVVEFTQNIVLVKDFSLVTMLVVVVDLLPHVRWKLMEGHVLLHLFVLEEEVRFVTSVQFLHRC